MSKNNTKFTKSTVGKSKGRFVKHNVGDSLVKLQKRMMNNIN